ELDLGYRVGVAEGDEGLNDDGPPAFEVVLGISRRDLRAMQHVQRAHIAGGVGESRSIGRQKPGYAALRMGADGRGIIPAKRTVIDLPQHLLVFGRRPGASNLESIGVGRGIEAGGRYRKCVSRAEGYGNLTAIDGERIRAGRVG